MKTANTTYWIFRVPLAVLLIFLLALFSFSACKGEAEDAKEGKKKSAQTAQTAQTTQKLSVAFVLGDARVQGSAGTGQKAIRSGMKIGQDAVIQGLEEQTVIDLRSQSGHTIRIKGKTRLTLASLYKDDKLKVEKTGLELVAGKVLLKVSKLTKDSSFQVKTGSATVGVRGTQFVVAYDNKKTLSVAVRKGKVAVQPEIDLPEAIASQEEGAIQKVREAASISVASGSELKISAEQIKAQSQAISKAVADKSDQKAVQAAVDVLQKKPAAPATAAPERFQDFEGMPGVEYQAPEKSRRKKQQNNTPAEKTTTRPKKKGPQAGQGLAGE